MYGDAQQCAEIGELGRLQGVGEDVGHVVVGLAVDDPNGLACHHVAQKVVDDVDVLGARLVGAVVGHVDCSLIVDSKGKGVPAVDPELGAEPLEPDALACVSKLALQGQNRINNSKC